jgi:twitching motility protein PilT
MSSGSASLLGRIAVHRRLITMDQLAQATAQQGRWGNQKKLGEILVEMGFLNTQQVEQLLEIQRGLTAQLMGHVADGAQAAPIAAAPAPTIPTAAPPTQPPPAAAPTTTASQAQALPTFPPPSPAAHPAHLSSTPPPTQPGAMTAPFQAPQATADEVMPPFPPPDPGAEENAVPNVGIPFHTQAALDADGGIPFTPAEKPVATPAPAMSPQPAAPPATQALPQPSSQAPAPSAASEVARATPEPAEAPSAEAEIARRAAGRVQAKSEALEKILMGAARAGASDVHLHTGSPIKLRIQGRIQDHGQPLDGSWLQTALRAALNPVQLSTLDETGQLDFAYAIDGVGRFRSNVYRKQGGLDGVFRVIPPGAPSLQQLGLPSELAKLTNFHQGMVLITGPSGCGKSSTLAAMLDIINEERQDHILTIEDPIEVIHPSKRSLVNQRECLRHTESFARALRAALREDPDVIAIGELRDLETISLALTAAETGHLVMATLHTNNAMRTINRLVGVFPSAEQAQIRTMVSESLRAIVSQRLVPTADGSRRVAALEILQVNKAVSNLIRDNRTFQLRSVLQTGRKQGMLLLDHSIAHLVHQGHVTREEALRHMEDPRILDEELPT